MHVLPVSVKVFFSPCTNLPLQTVTITACMPNKWCRVTSRKRKAILAVWRQPSVLPHRVYGETSTKWGPETVNGEGPAGNTGSLNCDGIYLSAQSIIGSFNLNLPSICICIYVSASELLARGKKQTAPGVERGRTPFVRSTRMARSRYDFHSAL